MIAVSGHPSLANQLPQGNGAPAKVRSATRPPRDAFDFLAPSRGREEVLRSGQTGMDAGLAAHGQGWPIAAGPRSRTGARACRAWARHRTTGARALGYLGLFQVTRRKGETISRRYRNNGYVHRLVLGRDTDHAPSNSSVNARYTPTSARYKPQSPHARTHAPCPIA